VKHADLEQFTEFVAATQAGTVRLAELLTGDRGRAEELAREGYARAYACWPRIRRREPLGYVRRCVIAACARRRYVRRGEHPRPGVATAIRNAGLPEPAPASDAALRALARLSLRERLVVVLRCYLDLTPDQVAVELDLAPGTVAAATARALAKLGGQMQLASPAQPPPAASGQLLAAGKPLS
jgi:DNA-directed RNA polymerase specialized sigma24 family protein